MLVEFYYVLDMLKMYGFNKMIVKCLYIDLIEVGLWILFVLFECIVNLVKCELVKLGVIVCEGM